MKVKFFRVLLAFIILSVTYLALPLFNALAYQDFTTWTEVDPSGHITKTASRITFTNIGVAESAYVYTDKGVDYFITDFTIYETINIASSTASTSLACALWGVSNTIGHWNIIASVDALTLDFYSTGAGAIRTLKLTEHNGGVATSSAAYEISLSTNYYLTIYRNESIGAFGTLYCKIYSDSSRDTLLTTLTVTLTEKQNFRYLYALAGQNSGFAGYPYSGYVENMEIAIETYAAPIVITTYAQTIEGAVRLGGYGSDTNGALTDKYFQIGVATGVYTNNYTATFVEGSTTYFDASLTSSNLTAGLTYYFRAVASNAFGTRYGNELSFLCYFETVTVTATGVITEEQPNGKWSAVMMYSVTPHNVTNAYITLSSTANLSDNITDTDFAGVDGLGQHTGLYSFRTFGTDGYGVLTSNTTYYYRGFIEFNGLYYYSNVRSFTTGISTVTPPDKPLVKITSVKDVSKTYNGTFIFEYVAQVITSNTTDIFYTQGFDFSLQQEPSLNILLPIIYSYQTNLETGNIFRLVANFDDAEWYDGQTVFVQAWVYGLYHGKIYSTIATYTPSDEEGSGLQTSGDTENNTLTQFEEMVKNFRISLHLTGTMGTWAFMGLIILLLSLIFGIAMIATPSGIAKTAVGVAWLLVSISVVGGFMFTGELGVWPILILVGGVVALILIVLSVKFSGSGGTL